MRHGRSSQLTDNRETSREDVSNNGGSLFQLSILSRLTILGTVSRLPTFWEITLGMPCLMSEPGSSAVS